MFGRAAENVGRQRWWQTVLVFVAGMYALTCLGCGPSNANPNGRPSTETVPAKPRLKLDFGKPNDAQSVATVFANFVDVASEVGLNFSYYNDAAAGRLYLPEALGGGAAAFDYDLDGWCDVFLANGRILPAHQAQREHHDSLFRNVNGRFQHVTHLASLYEFDYSHGVAVGDLNVDGFDDIFVANLGQARLFINQGDGSFLELSLDLLTANSSFWVAPLFVDLDGDGLEDLLLASYVDWNYDSELEMYQHGLGYPSPDQFNGGPYLALHNRGDSTFQDRTKLWGFTATAKCLGIAATDLDHDLKPEVYVANDGTANACYTQGLGQGINSRVTNASRYNSVTERSPTDSPNVWRDMAEKSGTAGSEDGLNEASMCVTLADFTRNGWTDIFVTNYYLKKNTLYANKGGLSFRDTSRAIRLDVAGSAYVSFGSVPLDIDLDGWWDVFIANGHVIGPQAPINEMPCQVLHSLEGVFFDVSATAGSFFQQQALGRCVVTLDSKNRGATDVLVTFTDRAVSLVENQAPAAHSWLCLEAFDPQHRALTGGRMELQFPNHTLVIPWTAGGSYLGESQKRWTIGLGPSGVLPVVKVYWPDGRVDSWDSLSARAICRLAPGRLQQYLP
ncbi:MAG: CRTAC1 family protein [Pirellulaceae bacterium]|nr:CRTAC1 family protein [Pirellulaceae bacterium]